MSWFTRSASAEMVHQNPHVNSTAERLVLTELEYAAAEHAWNTAFQKLKNYIQDHPEREPFALGNRTFLPLNHQRDLERSLLVHQEFTARRKRNELLQERADLRRSLGCSR